MVKMSREAKAGGRAEWGQPEWQQGPVSPGDQALGQPEAPMQPACTRRHTEPARRGAPEPSCAITAAQALGPQTHTRSWDTRVHMGHTTPGTPPTSALAPLLCTDTAEARTHTHWGKWHHKGHRVPSAVLDCEQLCPASGALSSWAGRSKAERL